MPKITPRRSTTCHRIFVTREVCKVILSRGPYHYGKDLGITGRGEMAIGRFNRQGMLIAIELLGARKPCQSSRNARWVDVE